MHPTIERKITSQMVWYDIIGTQFIRGNEQRIFASVPAINENLAKERFFDKYPHARLDSIKRIY